VEIVLLDNLGYLLGEIKLQTTIMNHCLGLTTTSGQIGTIFARAWFVQIEAKIVPKGFLRMIYL